MIVESSYSHGLQSIVLYASSLLVLVGIKILLTAVYNITFHPLNKYPGPKIAGATSLMFSYYNLKGEEVSWTQRMHEQYGEVVRLSPDRLSYINPQAWKDIAGHRIGGREENSKDPRFLGRAYNGEDSIVTVMDTKEHSSTRKIFSHAFSEKALRLQEPMIRAYVKQLRELLYKKSNEQVDLVKLYNCTTFDIMGDLAFGEPLGLLQASEYTPWVKAVFLSIKAGTFLRMARQYPVFQNIVELLTPRSLKEKRRLHFEHAVERVDRRLANGNNPDKPDIWSLILEKEGDHFDVGKMHANASIFMVAGTETTATLLSGLTFHLLKNPDKMQKVQDEVRALSEEDLTLDMLPRLPYMNACFEEALRVYPPVPIGLPRVVPKGGNAICGDWIPANTRVYVSQKAAYSSSLNFKDPESFIPERWLPDTGYESDKKEVMQPFSYGPRNCVGKNLAYHEMRIIFATVLWNFDLELCQESESWSNQKVWSVWSKGPLWVTAKPVR